MNSIYRKIRIILCGFFVLGIALGIILTRVFVFVEKEPLLSASMLSKEFYEDFYTKSDHLKAHTPRHPSICIVPHHLLAGHLIAQTLDRCAGAGQPKKIILMSPNHFSQGTAPIIGTIESWKTPYGTLSAASEYGSFLEKKGYIALQNAPFKREHGISNIVSFLKRTFPRAKVLPLMIRDEATHEQMTQLAHQMFQDDDRQTLIVASLDFSHEMPAVVAYIHDQTSIDALFRKDNTLSYRLDIDSRPTFDFLLTYAQKHKHNFTLLHNSNSADILGERSTQETTSYITGYYDDQEQKEKMVSITLSFFGDMMLDRYVRRVIDQRGALYPFAPIKRLLSGTHATIANFEGTMTTYAPLSLHADNAQFTVDPQMASVIAHLGFTHLSLANNHSHDFGTKGVEQTHSFILNNNMSFFGDYLNNEELSRIVEIQGKKIALVGYHMLYKDGHQRIIDHIKRLRSHVDMIVVMPHWGVELQNNFSQTQQQKAHQLIDAGADVIIGAHPHVVQPIEIYKEKAIFYSLGNFIFDQYQDERTKKGLGIHMNIQNNAIQYVLIPMGMENLQAVILDKDQSRVMVKEIMDRSSLASDMKQHILTSYSFTLPLFNP